MTVDYMQRRTCAVNFVMHLYVLDFNCKCFHNKTFNRRTCSIKEKSMIYWNRLFIRKVEEVFRRCEEKLVERKSSSA